MEILEKTDKNGIRQVDFYASYDSLASVDMYEHNVRYFDEDFVIKLYSKIKTQKIVRGNNYRLHSSYILVNFDLQKLEKRTFNSYKAYLEFGVANSITYIPENECPEVKGKKSTREHILKKFRSVLNLSHLHSVKAYALRATLGNKILDVYTCNYDGLAFYMPMEDYFKYQNQAEGAFKVKRDFFNIVLSPIENFERIYPKLINSLSMKLVYKNSVLFNLNDRVQYVYIIKTGEIEISYRKLKESQKLAPILRCTRGSLVGDFEVINIHSYRHLKATVISSECILYCLKAEHFRMLLTLSKSFRMKTSAHANEKYKPMSELFTNYSKLSEIYSHGTSLNWAAKDMGVDNSRWSIRLQENMSILPEYLTQNANGVSSKVPCEKRRSKSHELLLFKGFFKRKDSNITLVQTAGRQDSKDRELKLRRLTNFSLSRLINSTDEYVNHHIKNANRRGISEAKHADELLVNDKQLSKENSINFGTKNVISGNKLSSNKYFSNLLKERFSGYNSRFVAVTNPNHLPRAPEECIERIRKKLEKTLSNFQN